MQDTFEVEWLNIIKDADQKFFPGKTAREKLEILLADKELDAKLSAYFSKRVDELLLKLAHQQGHIN